MARIRTNSQHYTNIAEAIRSADPTGETGQMKPSAMSGNVTAVAARNRAAGRAEERNDFWDAFQNGGELMSGHQLFAGAGWTASNFHPKYKNVSYSSGYMCFRRNHAVTDMSEWCIDLSSAGDCSYLFHTCSNLTCAGTIILPDNPYNSGANYLFTGCPKLHTINSIKWTAKITQSKSSFNDCRKLAHIVFAEGSSIRCSLDFSDCDELAKQSFINIVSVLSSTTSGESVTFSKKAAEQAFTTAEWDDLIASKSNWRFSKV